MDPSTTASATAWSSSTRSSRSAPTSPSRRTSSSGNEISKGGFIDWNATNVEAAKLLARVGLSDNPATKIADIGVGKQQLVEIAKALSKEVKLLILDEPTAA